MSTNDTNKILYKELSYKLNGLLFNVHNKLGRFSREKQYGDELEVLLKNSDLAYKREFTVSDGNRVDFLIDDKIILDVKAKRLVLKDDYYQILRYLQSSGLKLGLIVNFRNTYLKPKRIINLR